MNACVRVCACEHRCSQRLEVPGTTVPGGVSCPTWVLGTELSLPLLEVFDQKASSLKASSDLFLVLFNKNYVTPCWFQVGLVKKQCL